MIKLFMTKPMRTLAIQKCCVGEEHASTSPELCQHLAGRSRTIIVDKTNVHY